MNLAPPTAIDQIPGTRTTRRIVEALQGLADGSGLVILTRKRLAALLRVTERTCTSKLRDLVAYGLLARLAADRFVFRFARKLTATTPREERAPEREDAETERQAIGAFVDGRQRAGALPREDIDPRVPPMILARARRLSNSGALFGSDVMQLCRAMGQAYVTHAHTAALEANNYPIHHRWVGPALDAMSRGARAILEEERRRAEQRKIERAEAMRAAEHPPNVGEYIGGLKSLLHRIAGPLGAT